MYYHEFANQPYLRDGTLVPRSALRDIFNLPDAGFCSVYAFTAEAKLAIRAQGDSSGLSRFPVYSDVLWMDLDISNDTPEERQRIREYARELTRRFKEADYFFTVWDSGSKGFHIGVRIEPMFGKDVPWSQSQFITTSGIICDMSLYQHGRLFRNPGSVHQKTGRKKTKLYEHKGSNVLSIPMLKAPERSDLDLSTLSDSDKARIGLYRLQATIQDAPKPGMRHTTLWGTATSLLEGGLKYDLVCGLLYWANDMLPEPKTKDEVERAVQQAAHQLGL